MLDLRRLPHALALAAKAVTGAYAAAPRAKTGAQNQGGSDGGIFDMLQQAGWVCEGGGAAGGVSAPGGMSTTYGACPRAGLRTWRRMARNPTVALALAAAKAPAKASSWTVVSDGAPAGAEDLIAEYILPLRATLLRDGLRAVEYGWCPFEKVWELADGRMVPAKLKPLLPDITEIVIDKASGAFAGLKNGDVALAPIDALVVRFDGEAGDMHGASRLENIRETAWWPWEEALSRCKQYLMKAAGIIPRVSYPLGTSMAPGGQEQDNGVLAQRMIAALQRGFGITMPVQFPTWAEGFLTKGIDPSKLVAWGVDFLEARNLHGDELKGQLDKFEALMVRGLYVPERSILEGSNGTKAEAGVHGDVSVSVSQDMNDQLLCIANEEIVDQVLELNFGAEARGTVRIEAAPLADEQKEMLRQVMIAVLSNPGNIDIVLGVLDLEAALEQFGFPMLPNAKQPKPGENDPKPDPNNPDPNADPNKPKDPASLAASIIAAGKAFKGAA